MVANDEGEARRIVQLYRSLQEEYEAVTAQIHRLLAEHRGAPENLSEKDLVQYRQMAHRRDDLYNEMLILESQLSEYGDS